MGLWKFNADSGSFRSFAADKIKTLYFPLGNERLLSSVTSDLHGDIKGSQDSFLLTPVSRQDLIDSRSSRNFWIYINKNKIWSVAGVCKDYKQIKDDKFILDAGILWHKVTRENKNIGLRARIVSFVPIDEPIEIMQIEITNISRGKIKFIPTVAIPIYARSADNLRDHRHVTSLLHRIQLHKFGVIVKPTLSFDEAGHKPNKNEYFVLGWDQQNSAPKYIYPTQEMFCGEEGDLESPCSVFRNSYPFKLNIQGKEAMGGLRFQTKTLDKGGSWNYIIVMGITEGRTKISRVINKFKDLNKVQNAFNKTNNRWVKISSEIKLSSGEKDFDNWFRWVAIQPVLRKTFGCSFLPDFDYGKGGRGWRDLWQDCLVLILNNPDSVRNLLVNNFSGVRIDGSNATIIDKKEGEFISDRNNISRVWMDHGIWPLFTLRLYIHETGDFKILSEETSYFRNREICRTRLVDQGWNASYGNKLKTLSGKIYQGTVLEHIIVQNLVQFFNVGSHNFIRLEGADWNDGLDMASKYGESVTFSAMYAYNLEVLSGLLSKLSKNKIMLAKELKILFKKIDYNNVRAKLEVLDEYFAKTKFSVSGDKITIDASSLAADLKAKARWLMEHTRKQEYLKEGFFNGYYDNRQQRVEGRKNGILRIMLTSQVFPIMSGAALDWQIRKIWKNVNKYLYNKKIKGYHLNSDFKLGQQEFGRAFSFAYADKENGSVFSHMVVMFAYALYIRGFVSEGYRVLSSLYNMAINTDTSKIYPCLPEYFNLEGRGMYSYLTGSASWFVFTYLSEVFGIKGKDGDLLIEPKLSLAQFNKASHISIERNFSGRRLRLTYSKASATHKNRLKIAKAYLNSANLEVRNFGYILIPRNEILKLAKDKANSIDIILS